MERPQLIGVVEQKYRRYVARVIKRLRAIPPKNYLGSGDPDLKSVWLEFAVQVKGHQLPDFSELQACIEAECSCVVESLPSDELALLWLFSDAYFDWEDDSTIPAPSELQTKVCEELARRVESRADEWELSEELERRYFYPDS
jgi:hypothetical protein